jgi:predicted transposase YdaD
MLADMLEYDGDLTRKFVEGKMEGKMEGKREDAVNLLKLGVPVSTVIAGTQLPEEEVRELQRSLHL